MTERSGDPPSPTTPSPARVWNYFLGGTDNFRHPELRGGNPGSRSARVPQLCSVLVGESGV
jgi:hypothetical protein